MPSTTRSLAAQESRREFWEISQVCGFDTTKNVFLLAYKAVHDPVHPNIITHKAATSWLLFDKLGAHHRNTWMRQNPGLTARGTPFYRATNRASITKYNEQTKLYSIKLTGGKTKLLKSNQFSAPDALQRFWNRKLGLERWGWLHELDLNVNYADHSGFTAEEAFQREQPIEVTDTSDEAPDELEADDEDSVARRSPSF